MNVVYDSDGVWIETGNGRRQRMIPGVFIEHAGGCGFLPADSFRIGTITRDELQMVGPEGTFHFDLYRCTATQIRREGEHLLTTTIRPGSATG